jgi:hypothetical protein
MNDIRIQADVRDSIREAVLHASTISHCLSSPSFLRFRFVILHKPFNKAVAFE